MIIEYRGKGMPAITVDQEMLLRYLHDRGATERDIA
jgi:hypothetical protein